MPITSKPLAALALALGTAVSHAAELGDATVRSHVGQPLVADVELVDLTPQDLADLQARLASRNVFQGANVTMSPALAGLNASIVKRDARRMLHLTTSAPVQSEVLHLFFELASGGRPSVRGVTLWLTPAPPAPPAPVPQPTRIVAAPPAPVPEPAAVSPAPEPKRPAARTSGVSIQLAAAGVPGKQATRADAELLGAVERAFAARAAKPGPAAKAPAEEKHAAEPAAKEPAAKAHKPAAAERKGDKPAEPKAEPKAAKPAAKVAEKPLAQQPETRPAPVKTAPPVEDKAMLNKLAELEAKLKTLQKMVNSAPAATAPAAAAPVAPTAAEAAPPAAPVAEAPGVEAPGVDAPGVDAPGRTAAGKITDAREVAAAKPNGEPHPTPATVEQPVVAKPEHNAPKPKAAEPKPAPAPVEEPAKDKKMSRPKVLTLIAGGSMALLAVLGVVIHFVRRRNAKNAKAQIKVWQSWRKKAIAEAAAGAEEGTEAADATDEAKAA